MFKEYFIEEYPSRYEPRRLGKRFGVNNNDYSHILQSFRALVKDKGINKNDKSKRNYLKVIATTQDIFSAQAEPCLA